MKNNVSMVIGSVMAVLTGVFFAFFGVLLSVFADTVNEYEIFVRIGIVLFIYGVLGALWGLLIPGFSWKWGLLLGGPAALGLIFIIYVSLLTGTKFDSAALVGILYAVMILLVPCLSAGGGSAIRRRRKKSKM